MKSPEEEDDTKPTHKKQKEKRKGTKMKEGGKRGREMDGKSDGLTEAWKKKATAG